MEAQSRLTRWKWAAFLLGTLWVSIGCTPATFSYLLMPFSDDKVQPSCKLAEKKEITICVVTNASALEARPDSSPAAANELAELFVKQLRERTKANKEKVQIVPMAKVREIQNQPDFASTSLIDIGKRLKADYVISLELTKLSLYERSSFQQLFRGNTEINVQVVDTRKPAGDNTKYNEPYRREYPSRGPVDSGDMSAGQFRRGFLSAVAADLSRTFTAYQPEERYEMD